MDYPVRLMKAYNKVSLPEGMGARTLGQGGICSLMDFENIYVQLKLIYFK